MAKHDTGYKLLFSHATVVADVLRGFVKEDWVREIDFDSLERVEGSYVTEDLRQRESAMLWKVRWRDRSLYVYILLEFQSKVEPFMAVRVMNVAAALFRLEKSRDLEDLRQQVGWMAAGPELDEGLRASVYTWLTRVLLPARFPGLEVTEAQSLEEVQTMLAERVMQWTREWKKEGREEGLQEGLQEGIQRGRDEANQKAVTAFQNFLLSSMAKRFGPLPATLRRRVRAVRNLDEITELGNQLLASSSLEDFERRFQRQRSPAKPRS